MALTVVVAACGNDGGAGGADGDPVPEGAALPDETFEMSDGTTATLADFTGRPLVVNFFASWCPPCRAEMPDFQAVHAEVGDDVRFLGFAMQDTAGAAQALVEETGVTYEWALDPDGAVFLGFGGFSMPTTLYVSADGEIVGRDNGTIDASALRQRLERLLGVDVP